MMDQASLPTLARPLAARVRDLLEVLPPRQSAQPPNEDILEQAAQALDAGKTHYTDRPGILPLREKVSVYLNDLGLSIPPGDITITCGVEEARFVALKQLLGKRKRLHSYDYTQLEQYDGLGAWDGDYLWMLNCLGELADLIGYQLEDLPDDADAFYIYSTNGFGIRQFLEFTLENPLKDSAWFVLELKAPPEANGLAELANGLQARALLSRLLIIGELPGIPGWRVGFMAGSSAHARLRAYKQSMTICTPSISQWAALGADLNLNAGESAS